MVRDGTNLAGLRGEAVGQGCHFASSIDLREVLLLAGLAWEVIELLSHVFSFSPRPIPGPPGEELQADQVTEVEAK